MDFRVKNVENGKVFVENDIYLTNEGRETSRDFLMLVKVREMDAGRLADKVWTRTGEIRPEATVIQSVNLTMPDHYNYIVEVENADLRGLKSQASSISFFTVSSTRIASFLFMSTSLPVQKSRIIFFFSSGISPFFAPSFTSPR